MKALRMILAGIDNYVGYGRFSTNPNTKRYWNKKLRGCGSFWRNEHYEYIVPLLPAHEEFSLLDVGCAIGDGCELLQARFPKAKISGADISPAGIEKAARKNTRIQYFVFDILKDPMPDVFDYITFIETLEHFDEPFSVINKSLAYTRRALIISTPYSPERSGPSRGYDEHRYAFNERTFTGYHYEVAQVTPYVESTRQQCIIFKIYPSGQNKPPLQPE